MEADITGKLSWFDVTYGQYLQGFILRDSYEQRLYVASLAPEIISKQSPFSRWPFIIADARSQATQIDGSNTLSTK